jgi:hypothetical protein
VLPCGGRPQLAERFADVERPVIPLTVWSAETISPDAACCAVMPRSALLI